MQLLAQASLDALRQGLSQPEPIVYRDNGNRSVASTEFLTRARAIAKQVGIERIAQITNLSSLDFPVFQSTRPQLLHHPALGVNTGGQGKGSDPVQAEISCIMESVEMFCAEPRSPLLVRGSYDFLRGQHLIVDPTSMFRRLNAEPVGVDEPLMWTPALHLASGRDILVPAERVFFYFPPGTYDTRSVFPMGTSGLGSGSTYLEAINHAIYELIERMYTAYFEQGLARVDCLWEEEFEHPAYQRTLATLAGELELQLFTVRLDDLQNIPMVTAILVGDDAAFVGQGAASDVDTAVMRATSEAIQGYVTAASGSREDLGRGADGPPPARPAAPPPGAGGPPSSTHAALGRHLPERRNLHLADYRSAISDQMFDDLREEFRFLTDWLERAGFPDACVANLTRHGVDVPVVRVLVPSMPMERASQCVARPFTPSEDRIAELMFSFRHPRGPR